MRTKSPQQADKMLNAAARLFGGQRFHEVRMEDIAAAAEVGKGTLYRYFTDKEELYLALLARASEQCQQRIRLAIDACIGHRAKLTALVQASFDFFAEQPHVANLIQKAEASRGPESPWQPTREMVLRWIVEILEQAVALGEVRACDVRRVALMLFGGVRSLILFSDACKRPGLAEAVVADFLDGLTA